MIHLTIRRKGGPSSGWYSPPRGTHTSEKHRAIGSGKSVPIREMGVLRRMLSEKNLDDLKIDERGLAYARDWHGNTVEAFGYNPQTGHIFATAFTHAMGHGKYLPGELYDDFVKVIRQPDIQRIDIEAGAFVRVPQIKIYIDRHTARDDVDAWNKTFDAAAALGRVGFPANTQVNLSSYMKGERVRELELGEL